MSETHPEGENGKMEEAVRLREQRRDFWHRSGERSVWQNLSMIGALGKMHEWEIHCRGALNNGVTKEEIRAIIHVIGIYCGVPQALECFRVARKVLGEEGLL